MIKKLNKLKYSLKQKFVNWLLKEEKLKLYLSIGNNHIVTSDIVFILQTDKNIFIDKESLSTEYEITLTKKSNT